MHPGEQGGGGLAEVGGAQLGRLALVVARVPGRCCRARRSGRCCRCTPSRRARAAPRRRGSCRRGGRCGTGRSPADGRPARPRSAATGRDARGTRPGWPSAARRRGRGSARRAGTCRSRPGSAGPRGGAVACERSAAASPGAPSASTDIVCAGSHSSTKTSHAGRAWRTRGATPAAAAALVLWSSFAAIDRQQLRRGARGSGRSRACRPPRPGNSCWSARPGSARP